MLWRHSRSPRKPCYSRKSSTLVMGAHAAPFQPCAVLRMVTLWVGGCDLKAIEPQMLITRLRVSRPLQTALNPAPPPTTPFPPFLAFPRYIVPKEHHIWLQYAAALPTRRHTEAHFRVHQFHVSIGALQRDSGSAVGSSAAGCYAGCRMGRRRRRRRGRRNGLRGE